MDDWLAAAMVTTRRVARGVETALKPHGMNIVQANGPGAAQSVFHLHIHVVPRAENDGIKMNWGINPGKMDEIKALAEKIKAALPA